MKIIKNLAIIVTLLIGLSVSCVPKPMVNRLDNFDVESPREEEIIPLETPIGSSGSYTLLEGQKEEDIHIWIILKDDFGNHYLQNPPINLSGEKWEASNVRVKDGGITKMLFVQVTNSGHRAFQKMVSDGNFEAFRELPEGSETLTFLTIKTE
ncbi:MAG: hypothetical protein IPM53_20885 [Anaerolineaceae bacterium]|nr:hypothetical protein [Anaerolineaceae bacterium]